MFRGTINAPCNGRCSLRAPHLHYTKLYKIYLWLKYDPWLVIK